MAEPRMSLEAEYRKMLTDAMADDPAILELHVFGQEAAEEALRASDGAAFINTVARILPVVSAGVLLALQEIDALKASIEASDDKTDA
jgi:hypothetical protein